jgi:hypothetical protein
VSASSREVFERRSSAVPSGAEGKQAGIKVWKLNSSDTPLPARSSSAVEKQAGIKVWKLNSSDTPLPARSSSAVEKQAGIRVWKLNYAA